MLIFRTAVYFLFQCIPRLNPRDAFFGGRTGVSKMYHLAKGSEKIKYIDFTSLYPWTNKYCPYGVGHPKIITSDFGPIQSYFGLALCSVLPPRNIFHPVLPYRSQKKLLFPLCRTCADSRLAPPCRHTDLERSITGTWTTLELQKAVDVGYQILKIFEVYHFEETSTALFRSYIDSFLKIKQESSGWPTECTTDQAKQSYIDDYFNKEGIRLDPQSIEINPGRRSVSKLCLNSFWGKFGQNDEGKKHVTFATDIVEFNQKFADPTIQVHDVIFPNDLIALMQWTHRKNFTPLNIQTNIFIAALTTAHARLKLHSELEKLGDKVLYYDTDSIIYVSDGMNDPPLGNYLGEFTDDLGGDYITEFVAAGTKNYAYLTSSGAFCCKIRGFTLNYKNSQVLNFESLKDLVLNNSSEVLQTYNPRKITRDPKRMRIVNRSEVKKYALGFDKRAIVKDYVTVPFGY